METLTSFEWRLVSGSGIQTGGRREFINGGRPRGDRFFQGKADSTFGHLRERRSEEDFHIELGGPDKFDGPCSSRMMLPRARNENFFSENDLDRNEE